MNDNEKFREDCKQMKSAMNTAEYVNELQDALSDILDGNSSRDLVNWTGMCSERAEDIIKLGAKIFQHKRDMERILKSIEEKPIEAKESKEEITPKLLCDIGIAVSFAQKRRLIADIKMKEDYFRDMIEEQRKK